MKKFILPLLVLLFVGSIMAVESEPSAVVGYVKYDCVAGLNTIALPMVETYALASDIATAYPGKFDTFNYWDNATQSWVGAFDLGGFWDNDFAVNNGLVLWPNSLESFSFYSIGDLPVIQPSYNMLTGLNMIMVPLDRSDITLASELGVDTGTLDTVNEWDNTTQSWVGAFDLGGFWDNDYPIAIGGGYWVNSLSDLTWPTPPPTRNQNIGLSRSGK